MANLHHCMDSTWMSVSLYSSMKLWPHVEGIKYYNVSNHIKECMADFLWRDACCMCRQFNDALTSTQHASIAVKCRLLQPIWMVAVCLQGLASSPSEATSWPMPPPLGSGSRREGEKIECARSSARPHCQKGMQTLALAWKACVTQKTDPIL